VWQKRVCKLDGAAPKESALRAARRCFAHTRAALPPLCALPPHINTHTKPNKQTVRDKCFKVCVTSPGSSLSGGEQKCISRCMDRYQDVSKG
jgi:hypothetical protein